MRPPQPEADATRRFLLELLGTPSLPDAALADGAATIDWGRLLDMAGSVLHPMLSQRIAARRVSVPETVRVQLELARRANAAMVALRQAHIRPVFEALDRAGVAFTTLKGFALAYTAYPSPETRVMSDLDLWIDEPMPRRAIAALEPLGWRTPWWRTMSRTDDARHSALRLGTSALLIELHGRQADSIPDVLESFWSRRVPADLGGLRSHILPTEEMLIHVALHLAEQHHFLAALPRLLDISLLIQDAPEAFSWTAFAERCRHLGISGSVATALGTAALMLRAPIPRGALAAFHVPDLETLCAMAYEQAWLSGRSTEHPQSLLAAPTFRGRASVLAQRLRDLVVGENEAASRPTDRAARVLRRLRYAARFTLPAMIRTLRRGTFRGASGARLRSLSADNAKLMDLMASAGANARGAVRGTASLRHPPAPAPDEAPQAPPPSSR